MSAREWSYDQISQDEMPALEALMGQALVMGRDWPQFWLAATGSNNCRVVRHGDRLAAGLAMFRAHQYLGGQPVPCVGINGVGVGAEYRGRGVGQRLMQGVLRELHAAGVATSILYPSTLAFYRGVGYERAGTRISYELPTRAIGVRDHSLEIARVEPDQYDQIKAVYTRYAPEIHGRLDRATFLWEPILNPPEGAHAYLALRDDQPVGYVVLSQGTRGEPLRVRDFCALDRQAGHVLATLLADHGTMIETIAWNGTPLDPLLNLLPEQRASVTRTYDWVVRIVDVRAALEARGYPLGLTAEVELEIVDDLLPANAGRWRLRIVDGRGSIERGGEGRIRLGVRELAAIFTGQFTPFEIGEIGEIDGSDQDRAMLALIFAGPRPRESAMF